MALVVPGHGRTVPGPAPSAPTVGGWPDPPNQVEIQRAPDPSLGFTPQQTNAQANYQQAMAHAMADPRFNAKQYDRPGTSRGSGQYAYAASQAAKSYADQLAAGEATRLSDAYANAGMQLGEQARNQDFGMALAGLQQQQAQNAAMQSLGMQRRASDFSGNVFNSMLGLGGNIMGGGSQINLLEGLL